MLICIHHLSRPKTPPSDAAPTSLTQLTTPQSDNLARVDNAYTTIPGDGEAATNLPTPENNEEPPPTISTNVYDIIDGPRVKEPTVEHSPRHSASLDPTTPTEPLYSQVMEGNPPGADDAVNFSGLYDQIGPPGERPLAAPLSKTLSAPPAAPENPALVVYSQVNKPKKRASDSALPPTPNGDLYQNTPNSIDERASTSLNSELPENYYSQVLKPKKTTSSLYDKPKSNDILYDDTLPQRETSQRSATGQSGTDGTDETNVIENVLYESADGLANGE